MKAPETNWKLMPALPPALIVVVPLMVTAVPTSAPNEDERFLAIVIAASTAVTLEVSAAGDPPEAPPRETGWVPVIAPPATAVAQLPSQSTRPLTTSLCRLIDPVT